MSKTVGMEPVARTSAGLRDALFDELDGLRAGTTNPARASSTAKLATSIIDTVRMEMDVHKHVAKFSGKEGADKLSKLSAPIELGSLKD